MAGAISFFGDDLAMDALVENELIWLCAEILMLA